MDRAPQHETGRSRRLFAGVVLVIATTAGLIATARASPGTAGAAGERPFPNPTGVLAIVGTNGTEADNPFFQELGTNGRSCATCHRPAQAWTITPAELHDRFDRTDGLDPIFRSNDGSNCERADVSTVRTRRRAFSLLLAKGLIRVARDVPAGAEFGIVGVDDPYRCGAPLTSVSMYRRPLAHDELEIPECGDVGRPSVEARPHSRRSHQPGGGRGDESRAGRAADARAGSLHRRLRTGPVLDAGRRSFGGQSR